MNPLDDLTVVVGLDAATIQQWEVSLPTLALHRRALFGCPWLLMYDWTQVETDRIVSIVGQCGLDRSPHLKLVPWPDAHFYNQYNSQRERMLTGFVYMPPQHVQTTWWMKIDTDAIALHADRSWLPSEWFVDADTMVVAPPWHYTKAKPGGQDIANWVEQLESFGDVALPGFERLNLAERIRGNKAIFPRFCSWLSFYRTSWTHAVASFARTHCGPYRLPVPSQDTYHWYMCQRGPWRWRKENMKSFGWTNCPRLGDLRQKAAESIGAGETMEVLS